MQEVTFKFNQTDCCCLFAPVAMQVLQINPDGVLATLENLENSGVFYILENSGKLEIYSGNFSKIRWYVSVTQSEAHNKPSIDWLCDTLTGAGGASYFPFRRMPCKLFFPSFSFLIGFINAIQHFMGVNEMRVKYYRYSVG